MKKSINDSLKVLNENDIISSVLFLIYRTTDNYKYATLSQLLYVLDKDSLFKFCSIFGGTEIKVPTIEELRMYIAAVYIYYAVNNEGVSFEKALRSLDISELNSNKLFYIYKEIAKVLDENK